MMHTLIQSRRIRGAAGEPIPTVFKSLEDSGTQFLRGQLVLVAGGPGTGKSAFALNLALRSGVSCLYFSADSDAFVQLTRSIAIIAGCTVEHAAQAVLSDQLDQFRDRLTGLPIRLSYSANPTLSEIENTIEAYEEVYGEYPALVIIDNITNVRTAVSDENGDPFSGLEGLADYFHTMARETESCVVALHHVTGSYVDADKPIPLSGVKNQISRVPEVVLTLHGKLNVSTVKNRGGQADASGYTFVELDFDPERMLIRDSLFSVEGGHGQAA